MKFLLLTFIVLITSVIANELSWVDEQVEAIKPPRNGIIKLNVDNIQDPFQKYSNNVTTKKIVKLNKKHSSNKSKTSSSTSYKMPYGLKISTIINNSARINNKWYKQNQKVGKYILKKINNHDVVLTYNGSKYLLSMHTKNKNLKFKK